ncbi:MAG: hydroxyacylglutathione hydrolase [Polyangiaceae bacterium]|nr:hydroxyacylglutathione hydrolase [Polyangiaceae bacterium]
MKVTPVPCYADNYAYLVESADGTCRVVVDASEGPPVLTALDGGGGTLTAILATHHHGDHVDGNRDLLARFPGTPVYGHASDRGRIPGQTEYLEDGATFSLGPLTIRALHVPGHTTGALTYVVTEGAEPAAAFTGDTLFAAGCGRLFEGTPADMTRSLGKLAALPPETRVYCGHEYTESNLRFAAHAEPSNAAVEAKVAEAAALRAEGRPTVPSTIGSELATNPFFRTGEPELRNTFGIPAGADAAEALRVVREAKNTF